MFCSCHTGIAVLLNSSYNESKWLTSQRCTDFQFLSFLMIVLTLGISEQSSTKCVLKGGKKNPQHKKQCCHCKLCQEELISSPSLLQSTQMVVCWAWTSLLWQTPPIQAPPQWKTTIAFVELKAIPLLVVKPGAALRRDGCSSHTSERNEDWRGGGGHLHWIFTSAA